MGGGYTHTADETAPGKYWSTFPHPQEKKNTGPLQMSKPMGVDGRLQWHIMMCICPDDGMLQTNDAPCGVPWCPHTKVLILQPHSDATPSW